ncbi:3-oxoacid CoA-transferase subunit B [Sinanaerobacter chloroacetimidivorans]|nr:3-oxoacid CoA-transferase subunit B [Sinanaerobacter chloroacetimidivorans]
MKDIKNFIAKNVASLFKDGDVVNLGVGIPTLAVGHLPEGVNVIIHAENGAIGCGPVAAKEVATMDLVDAANVPITLIPQGSCTDSATSFGIVRGGHVDYTVLGALQVDQEGNLASWIIPGKAVNGMGGAMDLVAGAKKVIIAMLHNSKDGKPKLLKKCIWPLTAVNAVTHIITDLAMIEIIDKKFVVKAMADGITKEELQSKTEAELIFPSNIKVMLD